MTEEEKHSLEYVVDRVETLEIEIEELEASVASIRYIVRELVKEELANALGKETK